MNRHVGFKKTVVEDEARQLTFPLLLLYPTLDLSSTVSFGPYQMDVSEHAGITEGVHPFVVISHGSGGSPLVYRTLAWFLAKKRLCGGIA